MGSEFTGSVASLVSRSDIRYEGTVQAVDQVKKTIQLVNGELSGLLYVP